MNATSLGLQPDYWITQAALTHTELPKVQPIRATLIDQGYAPNSINLTEARLRSLTHAAFNFGHINENTLLRIKAVKNAKGSRRL